MKNAASYACLCYYNGLAPILNHPLFEVQIIVREHLASYFWAVTARGSATIPTIVEDLPPWLPFYANTHLIFKISNSYQLLTWLYYEMPSKWNSHPAGTIHGILKLIHGLLSDHFQRIVWFYSLIYTSWLKFFIFLNYLYFLNNEI